MTAEAALRRAARTSAAYRPTVLEWLVGKLDPLLERLSEWAFSDEHEEQR